MSSPIAPLRGVGKLGSGKLGALWERLYAAMGGDTDRSHRGIKPLP